jgi:hypothetical protein
VGETISDMYGDMDSKNILELTNDRLIPFIENIGFDCRGCKMKWNSNETLNQNELAERDLKITQMGFKLDAEYIEKAYNVRLIEENEVDADKEIKSTYGAQ